MPHQSPPSFMTRYRLGYSPQRALPMALDDAACDSDYVNCSDSFHSVPLSAYETVQEFTYFPNSSVPPPPLSGLVPSALRQSTNHFSPQHLDVGHAFDSVENGRPVTSFPYYNNPFSEGCDVTNVSAVVQTHTADSAKRYQYYDYSVSGFVTCTSPTSFEMRLELRWRLSSGHGVVAILTGCFWARLESSNVVWSYGVFKPVLPPRMRSQDKTSAALQEDRLQLTSEPCRSQTSQFIGLTGQLTNTTSNFAPWGYYWSVTNTTSLFSGADPQFRKGYIGVNDLSALDTPFQNLFQIIASLLWTFRRDLITYDGSPFGTLGPSAANTMRAATSNPTMMERVAEVRGSDDGDRPDVPVLEYLRPVSRRKSLGSAIVAVFVATFTMPFGRVDNFWARRPGVG
ncbi:hypothetical protein R3P38DRAFT_3243855 [Favolaschia claudopus]|uniref:Uncharacterized protein n=1 Tax=Favolaschia claudopus TaxID=2862362 RepID=A0AAV9Z2K0_9AGAR